MVRGKTEMKRIENKISRQVTFSKRRSGLLKKAFELSVLCDAEVAVMVFSTTGKLYEFSSSGCFSVNKTTERYQKNAMNLGTGKRETEENMQHLKEEAATMTKTIEHLEKCKAKLLGLGLESINTDELQEIETHLHRSLSKIRARKKQLFKQKIEQLKEEERILAKDNSELRSELRAKLQVVPLQAITWQEVAADREILDVETELLIGRPEKRTIKPFINNN